MASSPHLDINKTVHGIVESLQRISTLVSKFQKKNLNILKYFSAIQRLVSRP